ncbi:MAG: SPFH domain-containing protein [Coriobacteriia bacterium]|jgi:membrane protease subunit (stomatin/prohibitin family)|nr:SPFH domain-containing protein [Coriobacteriia bacterium]MDR2714031.1 SPFH domain-containing protein [Coriobacteriales bacterium]
MGLIQAFVGSFTGTFADQWKEFYTVPPGVSSTAGVFPAMEVDNNMPQVGLNRVTDQKGTKNIITNGSKIVIPEGYGIVTIQSGEITAFASEPGGYIYSTDSKHSASLFAGGGIVDSILKNSWERVGFRGMPAEQQLIFFVNLKEIANNRFGTQSAIYWFDGWVGAQVGAMTRGTYTLKITDPLTFIKGFLPVKYLTEDAPVFDFQDYESEPIVQQLFNEVIQSLGAAFSIYTNDPARGNTMSKIQGDSVGFAQTLSEAVEQGYQWATDRGLTIVKAALQAIDYDEKSREIFDKVMETEALGGARLEAFKQQSIARGIEAAGKNESGGGPAAVAMMGMGIGSVAGATGVGGAAAAGGVVVDANGTPVMAPGAAAAPTAPVAETLAQTAGEDPYERLAKLKGLLDTGVITQEDFDAAKKDLLGL